MRNKDEKRILTAEMIWLQQAAYTCRQ